MEKKIKSQQELIKELEDKITANMEEINKVHNYDTRMSLAEFALKVHFVNQNS